jgi:hypothetical protein
MAKPKPRKLCGMELATTFTDEYSPFNVVVAVHLQPVPGLDTLNSALSQLQAKHPLLSVCLSKDSGKYSYHNDPGKAIPVELVEDAAPDRWRSEVENHLGRAFDRSAAPLMRASLVKTGASDRTGTLILNFHHSIIDGASIAWLVDDLMWLVCGEKDPPVDLGPQPQSPPVSELLPTGYRGVMYIARLKIFLFRQMLDELGYRWSSRGQRLAAPAGGRCRVHSFSLEPGETKELVRGTRRQRLPLNALLSAALVLVARKTLYANRARCLRYFTFADLRPYLEPPLPPNGLGAYLAMLRFTVKTSSNLSLVNLAQTIARQISESTKRGDKFLANLLSPYMIKMMLGLKMDRMGSTALSYTGPMTVAREYGSMRVRGVNAYVSNFDLGPPLAAQTRILHGRLVVDLLYLDSELDRESIKGIETELRNVLATIQG